MKKTFFYFIFFILTLSLFSCKNNDEEIRKKLNTILDEITFDDEISSNITLKTDFGDDIIAKWNSSNEDLVSNTGVVKLTFVEQKVEMKLTLTKKEVSVYRIYNINLKGKIAVNQEYINQQIKDFSLPTSINDDIILPSAYNGIDISWTSLTMDVISNDGKITKSSVSQNAKLRAAFTYDKVTINKDFSLIVEAFSNLERLNMVMEQFSFPSLINENLNLQTTLDYNIHASYYSSDELIMTNDGSINFKSIIQEVKLEVVLKLGDDEVRKEFTLMINKIEELKTKEHQLLFKSNTFIEEGLNDLVLKGDLLEIAENKTVGSYESAIYDTISFYKLVGTFSGITSKNSCIELQISVGVDGIFSKYVSYGKWGLGLQNSAVDHSDSISGSLIKISDDEVVVLNSKTADQVRFKVILTRNSVTSESPKLSLISLALQCDNYVYEVSRNLLPLEVNNDVPILYQGSVPVIGGSICSPTSCTMLLKNLGFSFVENNKQEHEVFAYLAKDYGHNIFGNWAFNTNAMSAYSVTKSIDSYVARMYSIEELLYSLAKNGPCAISVKGQMNSDKKSYYTNGHLLVITGYKIENDELILYSNDPNVQSGKCIYTEQTIKNTWRGIAYILEKK